jgi:hypothetical protein
MDALRVIFGRLVRLLPFLAMPIAHRRFYSEFFSPYPDICNAPDNTRPAAPHARPYLRWADMNVPASHRGEPFW